MNALEVNNHLQAQNLFALFRAQLTKDFEGAGLDADFTDQLPSAYGALEATIAGAVAPLLNRPSLLTALLYRVDISEKQLQQAGQEPLDKMLAGLIIRRVLQKVILRMKFSK